MKFVMHKWTCKIIHFIDWGGAGGCVMCRNWVGTKICVTGNLYFGICFLLHSWFNIILHQRIDCPWMFDLRNWTHEGVHNWYFLEWCARQFRYLWSLPIRSSLQQYFSCLSRPIQTWYLGHKLGYSNLELIRCKWTYQLYSRYYPYKIC